MERLTLFLFVFLVVISAKGQYFLPAINETSEKDFLIPGVYLSYEDFQKNDPITPEEIVTNLDPNDQDFFYLLFKERSFKTIRTKKDNEVKSTSVWGYSDGEEVYLHESNFKDAAEISKINSEHPFARVNILGTLSLIHYVHSGKKYNDPITRTRPVKNKKPVEFIFDTRDGRIYPATTYNLARLIQKDKEILSEFRNYKGDKTIKFYVFLKKYNNENPLIIRGNLSLN